jgi:hypothetical protein
MTDKAQIHSFDALASFRVRLIQYVEKATTAIDEVSSDVRRTMVWLEDQQKPYWETQLRKRRRTLEETQHENFGAKLSQFRESSDAKQMAVQRAKRALQEAKEKMDRIKVWCRRYPSDVEPMGREVERLRTVLDQDLKKAVAYLERILQALEAYAALNQGLEPVPETGESDGHEFTEAGELEEGKA